MRGADGSYRDFSKGSRIGHWFSTLHPNHQRAAPTFGLLLWSSNCREFCILQTFAPTAQAVSSLTKDVHACSVAAATSFFEAYPMREHRYWLPMPVVSGDLYHVSGSAWMRGH